MKDTPKIFIGRFNPGEAKVLKARVYDLSGLAAKQALYGIIQILSFRVNMSRSMFEGVIEDSVKYNEVRKGGDVG